MAWLSAALASGGAFAAAAWGWLCPFALLAPASALLGPAIASALLGSALASALLGSALLRQEPMPAVRGPAPGVL